MPPPLDSGHCSTELLVAVTLSVDGAPVDPGSLSLPSAARKGSFHAPTTATPFKVSGSRPSVRPPQCEHLVELLGGLD